jgi:hypothetical protein
MTRDEKKKSFLLSMIFNPEIVWLPEDYEEILLDLNLWPKGMMHVQKVALLKQDEFTIRGTTFHTKQPRLIFQSRDGTKHEK